MGDASAASGPFPSLYGMGKRVCGKKKRLERRFDLPLVVVFNHNMPVRFINQLKLKGLSRSHPVHVATAAVVTNQQGKKKKRERKGKRVVVVNKHTAR